MTATVFEIRKPAWRYHDVKPADGLALTEWAIETQLSLAHDYDETDLLDVLRAFNPDLDESIAKRIEELLDLGEEVADAEDNGPSGRFYAASDDYAAALQQLARLVRGGGGCSR